MTSAARAGQAVDPHAVLLRDDRDGVATLTLNRPAARNALSKDLIVALQTALNAIADDSSVRTIVIAANGPAFCAGHDMKEIRANDNRAALEALFARSGRMFKSIMALPKPVIARVHATATAAGCQLVATCDLAVAADTARFATPGVDIGLFCSTPMVPISRAIPRKKAVEMLFSGTPIDATDAERFGLVNKVVPASELDDAVADMARVIDTKSAAIIALGKEAFYRQLEMGISDAYDFCSEVMVRNIMMTDGEEGIDAFLEKRAPVWRGR